MKALSLRARLTLWYTLVLCVVLSLFGAAVSWQVDRIGSRRVDRDLDTFAATLSNVVREELGEHDDERIAADHSQDTVATAGRALAIFDARGGLLTARWNAESQISFV